MKVRIGIDIDSTVGDFVTAFVAWYNKTHNTDYEVPALDDALPMRHYIPQLLGVTSEQFEDDLYQAASEGLFLELPVYPGAVQAVQQLVAHDCEIVFITRRNFSGISDLMRTHTETWLSQAGFPYHELHLTSDKWLVGVDLLIEDNELIIEQMQAAGCQIVLFTAPWNKEHAHPHRFFDWNAALDVILPLVQEIKATKSSTASAS